MKRLKAGDIMNPDVITVEEDLPLQELAAFFIKHQISGAPVVDPEGKLLGVVSLMDLARSREERARLVREGPEKQEYFRGWEDRLDEDMVDGFHVEVNEGRTVRDIMNPVVYKVWKDTPIREMAELMIKGRIHRLLVMNEERVVGIVTTMDMLKVIRDLAK